MEEGFIGEYSGRTDFHKIAAEFILQRSILFPAEVEGVMRSEDIEVSTTRIVTVISNAAETLNAPIHLMANERAEGLITMRPLREVRTPVDMSGHDRHILQMALPSFITYRAVVWMIHHQPFDD